MPTNTYTKGDFGDILFMEFNTVDDRNLAVGQLRSAKINKNGQQIWASNDRPPLVRAARNYCFGIKYFLKDTMGITYPIRVDDTDQPYTVTVGGELALTVKIDGGTVIREWAPGDWADWGALHNHAKVIELTTKCDEIVTRAAKSLKGSAKGGSKGSK